MKHMPKLLDQLIGRSRRLARLARNARSKKFFSGQHAMLLKRHFSISHRPDEQSHIPDEQERSIRQRKHETHEKDLAVPPFHEHQTIERSFLMNEPVTTMDTRYSEPDGVVTPWEETRRVLETAELFWLSTVRADGRPHVTPVVAVWHDEAIHFSTADTEQKAVNLRGNPHVILTTACNRWDA